MVGNRGLDRLRTLTSARRASRLIVLLPCFLLRSPHVCDIQLIWTPNTHFIPPPTTQSAPDGGVDGRAEEVSLESSPESHAPAGSEARGGSTPFLERLAAMPLPAGFDEGYDPVTGAKYYIDHVNKVTSWTDPRLALLLDETARRQAGEEDESTPASGLAAEETPHDAAGQPLQSPSWYVLCRALCLVTCV